MTLAQEEAGVAQDPAEPSRAPNGRYRAPLMTAKDARTFNFTVPAPRGQILDRRGVTIANSEVAHYPALALPPGAGVPEDEVAAAAARAVDELNRTLGTAHALDREALLTHYAHRRWLPFRIGQTPLTGEEKSRVEAVAAAPDALALALEPAYLRRYPGGGATAHVTGYVGKETPLETGEIRDLEILFEEFEGRAGLELQFDGQLKGTPGTVNRTYASDGSLVRETVTTSPEPGLTLVTTLDLEVQRVCAEILAKHAKRGAVVLADAETGDLIALVSHPTFDPGAFVPWIGAAEFRALEEDPDRPLFGRAFAAAYPPGSTFKPFVACALLARGVISPHTVYPGKPSVSIDGHTFRNWTDNDEGMIDVAGALARSCNTFFYQAAVDSGSEPIVTAALSVGFGQATGLPLPGEAAGSLPAATGTRGDSANVAIGQGSVLVSPVQLTLGVGALANGRHVLAPRLVSQIQDYANRVVQHDTGRPNGYLTFGGQTVATVQLGMDQVVNGPRGTAAGIARSRPRIAGKTGTAQWAAGDGRQRRLGWFTGFTFSTNPRLAFTAVYEGDPGESVGGSSKAAPIIEDVLEAIYSDPGRFGFEPPLDTPPPDPALSPWVSGGSGPFPAGTLPPGSFPAHSAQGYLGSPTLAPGPGSSPPPQPRPDRARKPFWHQFLNP